MINYLEKFTVNDSYCFKLSGFIYPFMSIAVACVPAMTQAGNAVDFRFSPPQWQATICFPDDPHKSLVNHDGELLYGYPDEQHQREFATRIGVATVEGAQWRKQELLAPRIPVVRTFREAKGLEILEETFSIGGKSRGDMIWVHITNKNHKAQSLAPRIVIDSTQHLKFDRVGQTLAIARDDVLTASLKMTSLTNDAATRRLLQLEPVTVPAEKSADFFVLYSIGRANTKSPSTLEQAMVLRQKTVEFWQAAPLPYGRVQVPDIGIQGLLDAAIRNIWQSREIKNGLPAFQVGPTVYHGLWIVDGAFSLEAAAILGAGKEARGGVAYELRYQQPDGGIEAMRTIEKKSNSTLFSEHAQELYYSKENGIVLWTLLRHAQLTQDKAWLESLWPNAERIAKHIHALRQKTLANDTPLDDGLIPADFTDGGQEGFVPEYSNVYWNLAGLRSFAAAARWLGKTEEATQWQAEYDDFMGMFRKAAQRDMQMDGHGNHYLPNRMDGQDLPQRAQWAFLHAVYPGQVFSMNDPLVAGNLAMLEATEREGMVYGTGWQADGIWNYFGSFYAHAWLWQGQGAKAAQELYAFANHAAPVLDWREEQSLKAMPYEPTGDMPHNWASAEFIRLVVHLLALDRGSELHLLEGLPLEWTRSGAVTRLHGVATPFGPLTMELKVSTDRRSAHLHIEPLADPSCSKVVVHLRGMVKEGEAQMLELDPKQPHDSVIWLKANPQLSRET